jgi:hypothetical protein
MEAQLRELQSNQVQSAQRRIEDNSEHQRVSSSSSQFEQRLKAELAAQEAHWKEAYDTLLAENNALKSSGSEALLASQWRQRYETCLAEKEDLKGQLQATTAASETNGDSYEAKYRDLKESFRLYRKKAKEIFEAQERGAVVAPVNESYVPPDFASGEAKISYLRNLMVNYLSSDSDVREHMERAIGTVLKFSPEDMEKIQKKKQATSEAWF